MNEFFLASNRSIAVPVGDKSIEVKQVIMESFDLFVSCAEPIKAFLKDKTYSDEILTELFQKHAVQVLAMLAHLTGIDYKELLELTADQEGFIKLIHAALTINAPYFIDKPKEPGVDHKARMRAKKQENPWFDSFQFLISMGHQHSEIMKMSYGAFLAYTDAAVKRHNMAVYHIYAPHMDQKGQSKLKKELKID